MAFSFVRTSSQYITVASSTAAFSFIQNSAVFTVSLWVKIANASDTATFQVLLSNISSSASKGANLYYDDSSTADGKVGQEGMRGVGGSPSWSMASANNAVNDTNWHNFIATGNGSNVYLYIDNSQVATVAVGTLSSGDSSFDLKIGSLGTGTDFFFDGNLAEIAFWDVALTADERNALSKGAKSNRIRPQSLAIYAPLLRNLIDYDSARTLTNNNSATVADHPRVY